MNKQELIERIEDFPCEASLVTEMIRINKNTLLGWVKELDEPQPIKLKDVIERIEKFDLGTKAVWINEILFKLGSDYGLHKYYAGYKQGKFDGAIEREKVVVPQIVADYIKYAKTKGWDLLEAMKNVPYEDNADFRKWFYKDNNTEVFARAWIDGYTIEKEKRYLVSLKNGQPLVKSQAGTALYFSQNIIAGNYKFTRKELEEAGFGEVFNSPLFEIEEVE